MTRVFYLSFALLGMVMHAVGLVMQKKGIDDLNLKKLKEFKVSREFFVWLSGILLAYVISVIPTGIASGGLAPQIVSSISGLCIVLVLVLSHFWLKERVFFSDLVFSVIIILSIFGVSVLRDVTLEANMNPHALYILICLPFLLLLPIPNKKVSNHGKTILFAAFSGLTSGLSFVLLNIAVKESGGTLLGLLSCVYAYEYTAVGFLSAFAMQAAYRFGKIINIAPVQISLSVVFPLICSYFIFQKGLTLFQDLLIIVIGFCCFAILKKHG